MQSLMDSFEKCFNSESVLPSTIKTTPLPFVNSEEIIISRQVKQHQGWASSRPVVSPHGRVHFTERTPRLGEVSGLLPTEWNRDFT